MNNHEISDLIKELIGKTTVGVKEISIIEDNSQTIWFRAEVNEPHFFIGREGEALFALNHIVRRIVENKINLEALPPLGGKASKWGSLNIFIDINGYQQKRVENIRAIAHMMAERARYFKSSIEIDPMSAFERRIVHEFLSSETDLKTESMGDGLKRRVVIKYMGSI